MTPLHGPSSVLGRVVFASVALAGFLGARRSGVRPRDLRDWLALAAAGVLLALHWTAFFQAVQVSTVAIALLSYSTFPLFTTALEPLLLPEPPRPLDVPAPLLLLPRLHLVSPMLR